MPLALLRELKQVQMLPVLTVPMQMPPMLVRLPDMKVMTMPLVAITAVALPLPILGSAPTTPLQLSALARWRTSTACVPRW